MKNKTYVYDVPSSKWDKESYFYHKNKDTLKLHDIYAILRYDEELEIDNVRVACEILSPNDIIYKDTIVIPVHDKYREFYGKKTYNTFEINNKIYDNVRFKESGTYRFKITPLKRDIKGVSAFGIMVIKEK